MKSHPSLPAKPVSIGILGCGNMGGAIARGILVRPELAAAYPVHVFDMNQKSMEALTGLGAVPHVSARSLAEAATLLILAVKPIHASGVLRDIAPVLSPDSLIISIAAGFPLIRIAEESERAAPVMRMMPNTLVSVGEAVFALCFGDEPGAGTYAGHAAPPERRDEVRALFSRLGVIMELDESKFNAFTALAGCGPAYVFYFAECLTDAGVTMGFTREQSRNMALSLMAGGVALARKGEKGLAELREEVCSPGGMTIAGVNHLDRAAVKGNVIDAVLAALARGEEMEKE